MKLSKLISLVLVFFLFVQCGLEYYLAEYLDFYKIPNGGGTIADIIPSQALWGKSQDDFDVYYNFMIWNKRSKQLGEVACEYSLDDILIGEYPLNVYFVFNQDMGSYMGLSKIVYFVPNDKAKKNEEVTNCYAYFTELMREECGMPVSQTKAVTTWEMDNYTIDIGTGRFTNYTGYENFTVAIVFSGNNIPVKQSQRQNSVQEYPEKNSAPVNPPQPQSKEQEYHDNSSKDENSQFTGPMVTVKVGSKYVEIHQSFKDLMDSYEAFFDSYLKVLTSGDYLAMMDMLEQYSEMIEELDRLEDADLTSAELAYYVEVHARIMGNLSLSM